MGSAGEDFDQGDVLSAARLAQKTVKVDTGANINAETKYDGMVVFPTSADGDLTADIPAVYDNDDTTFRDFTLRTVAQTVQNKTLDSTNILQNTQMHFYNRRFYDWSDLDYLTTGGVGTESITKNTTHGGVTFATGSSTNDTAFGYYGAGGTAHTVFRRDRKFEVYFLLNINSLTGTKEIEVGLYVSGQLGAASLQTTGESITVKFDDATSANWIARNGTGAAQTATTGTVAVGTDECLIAIINDETNLYFYVNGTLIATHSTNLPTGTSTLYPQFWVKTQTTNSASAIFTRGYGWCDHS